MKSICPEQLVPKEWIDCHVWERIPLQCAMSHHPPFLLYLFLCTNRWGSSVVLYNTPSACSGSLCLLTSLKLCCGRIPFSLWYHYFLLLWEDLSHLMNFISLISKQTKQPWLQALLSTYFSMSSIARLLERYSVYICYFYFFTSYSFLNLIQIKLIAPFYLVICSIY
jgi:hypothetical protein